MDDKSIRKYQGEKAEDMPGVEEAIKAHEHDRDYEEEQQPDASKGMMTMDTLPQEVSSVLPDEESKQMFVAAYNSIFENNGNKDAAMQVAWQSIEHSELYSRGQDGKFQRTPMEQGLHRPQPLSES